MLGAPNQGVLNRLNDSTRTCSLIVAGSVNVLNSEKSISPGRFARMSSKRVGSVRSVNGGWICQATGSSGVAQFCACPLIVCVQVLN